VRFIWLSTQALHDGDQVFNLDEARLVLVKHVEDAPEVLDLLLRVHLENVDFILLG